MICWINLIFYNTILYFPRLIRRLHNYPQFFVFQKFVPMKYKCPEGYQFRPQTIWPQYPCAEASEVQCRIPVKPTPPVVPVVVPEIVPNYICAEENRYYTNNRDCGSYIECKVRLF